MEITRLLQLQEDQATCIALRLNDSTCLLLDCGLAPSVETAKLERMLTQAAKADVILLSHGSM